MTRHLFPIRVYYEDTDAGGIVYNANYLKFAERARTEWLRSMGFSSAALRETCGILIVVRKLEVEYKKPARLDDSLEVETTLMDLGGSSMTLRQIVRAEGMDLSDLVVQLICVAESNWRPTRWPEILRAALAGGGNAYDDDKTDTNCKSF